MNKQEAIETLEKYRHIHQDWVDFLKKHSEFLTTYVGDVGHHEEYVKEYDAIIEYVKGNTKDELSH